MLKEEIQNTKLAISTQGLLIDNLQPFEQVALEWQKKSNQIIVTDEYDEIGMQEAKQALKFVSSKRIELENKRKELKADSLEYGRAIDSCAKVISSLFYPIEENLKYKAEYAKRVQEQKQAETLKIRLDILNAIGYAAHIPSVELMDDETWEMFLDGAKAQIKKRQAEEKRAAKEAEAAAKAAEAEAEARRVAEAMRIAEMEAENKRLKEIADQATKENNRIREELKQAQAVPSESKTEKKVVQSNLKQEWLSFKYLIERDSIDSEIQEQIKIIRSAYLKIISLL